jgi:hypothetical protein
VSHENESPALPPGVPRAEPAEDLPFHPDTPGHVMSPGTRVPRPQTMVGIGSIPPPKDSVPAAPLTEVAPAPAVRKDPSGDAVVREVPHAGVDLGGVPRPRPSETHVGATSPLHTAEDANTAVNLSSLSSADAGRILAAAEADGRSHPRPRAPTLLGTSAQLPPPPPLRRASSAPSGPPSSEEPATTRVGALPPPGARSPYPHMHAQTLTHGTPPPASTARGSAPPPPSLGRPKTLLLFDAPPDLAVKAAPVSAVVAGSGHHLRAPPARPGESGKPPVRFPTVRAGPPPPAEDGVEELSSGLLMEDSGQFRPGDMIPPHPAAQVVPPQPISSSSLVDDPDSNPELEPDPEDEALRAQPHAPLDAFAPMEIMPLAEPLVSPDPFGLVSPDPFGRPTEPPRFRDLRPDDSGRTFVAQGPPPRPQWLLPMLIVGGMVGLAFAFGILVIAVRSSGPTSEEPSKTTASAAPVAATPPATAGVEAAHHTAATPRAPEVTGGSPCVLAGAPHVLLPKALLKSGIETASSADRIALGAGVSDHEGFVIALDPSTFAVLAASHPHTTEVVHRVVPLLGASSDLGAFLEGTHKHAAIESAYPVDAEPPFVLGVAHGKLIWSTSRTTTPEPLWPIDPNAPVEALRAIALPDHAGYAVAFRQGASLFLGGLHEDKTPNGELVRIGGLGPQMGAPTMAAGADHVVVAWADRTSAVVPWAVRWVKWHPGTDPGEPAPFPLPTAGDGAATMSPSITSLSGGRFVIAWTEAMGPLHVVRAEALDASEHPIGATLTVSADGVNAGQGMPVFTPDGRGGIVFLSTPTGATASVVAVPVICPAGG